MSLRETAWIIIILILEVSSPHSIIMHEHTIFTLESPFCLSWGSNSRLLRPRSIVYLTKLIVKWQFQSSKNSVFEIKCWYLAHFINHDSKILSIFFKKIENVFSKNWMAYVYSTIYSQTFSCTVGSIFQISKICVDRLCRTVWRC